MVVCAPACSAPAPLFTPGTPDDLTALATDTFDAVVESFPSRRDCLEDVTITGAWELDDRARYQPDERRVTVRIPATAAQLEVSMVHEIAHHLEFACPLDDEERAAFLVAQGFEPDDAWLDGATWETTPSEHWATAVVTHVLGRADPHARIVIEQQALDVVAAWAG
jgi:hypothetical protein